MVSFLALISSLSAVLMICEQIVKPSELAPVSVLEFAEMATEAGIPPYVLSVLPGGGATGKDIISNPLIRKVDVTVRRACSFLILLNEYHWQIMLW